MSKDNEQRTPKQEQEAVAQEAKASAPEQKAAEAKPKPKPKKLSPEELEAQRKRKAQKRRKRNAQGVARRLRRERAIRLGIHSGIWVGLPTLIACIYYGLIASPQYESSAVVAIQRPGFNASASGPLAALIPATSSGRDTGLVREYIQSRAMLNELIEDHGFIDHFASTDNDRWSRLASDASTEATFEYYRELVGVEFDAHNTTLSVSMRAFTAERAQSLLKAMLTGAEKKVNTLSDRIQADTVALAEKTLSDAETRLANARKALVELQTSGAGINPVSSVETILSVKAQLEGELARAEAELQALRSTQAATAPRLTTQRARVTALRRQIQRQDERLIGTDSKNDTSAPESLLDYEAAMAEKEFAVKAYEMARQALEAARVEAGQQRSYMVTLSEPSLPNAATYPHRLWKIATVFFVSLALMGVLMLLGAAVREHARV